MRRGTTLETFRADIEEVELFFSWTCSPFLARTQSLNPRKGGGRLSVIVYQRFHDFWQLTEQKQLSGVRGCHQRPARVGQIDCRGLITNMLHRCALYQSRDWLPLV